MKKLLVAVAMVLGLGTSVAFAQDVENSTVVEAQAAPVEFVKMDAATLPQAVVDALAKDNEGSTIKEAFVAEKPEGKVFKVVITTKDGQEVTALLNEKGEAVKE